MKIAKYYLKKPTAPPSMPPQQQELPFGITLMADEIADQVVVEGGAEMGKGKGKYGGGGGGDEDLKKKKKAGIETYDTHGW